jgi:uncharacterized protein (DUF2249 family)
MPDGMGTEDRPARTLDIRDVPEGERAAAMADLCGELGPGESLRLIADHDPVDLRVVVTGPDSDDQFGWAYLEEGPDTWCVEVQRLTES